ncbi:hypothetical protein [Flaviaesturariibacter amylovorans]|uniref:Uncharacterized protein n=1 Tax=Flaviaesturariibacter amylovorans TaxID=1084520 RepID=A0ABP8GCL2_9BACT
MRKAHVFFSLLLCALLAARVGLHVAGADPEGVRFATGTELKSDRIQLPHQEGELSAAHFFGHDGQWSQRLPLHPDLLLYAQVPARTQCAALPPAAQNDAAARAYLRHLHPTHAFT